MMLRTIGFFILLGTLAFGRFAAAIDREAFTFTRYDLTVQLDPPQHRITVRGRITLRNDSPSPQKTAILQISSSLDWLSIQSDRKALEFTTQTYASDIDHTGALSEAIIALPKPLAPKETLDLDIGYDGVIVIDATRLTRIGTPEAQAVATDWDQIGPSFTGVRGVGYVAWYPIATESVDWAQAEGQKPLENWRLREATGSMHVVIKDSRDDGTQPTRIVSSETACIESLEAQGRPQQAVAECTYSSLDVATPSFFFGDFGSLSQPTLEVDYFPAHDAAARLFSDSADHAAHFLSDWFGPAHKLRVVDLPDSNSPPFESGAFLAVPLADMNESTAWLLAAHQYAHGSFFSARAWINEGLSHFAQALYIEHEKGRQAALAYLAAHQSTAPPAYDKAPAENALSISGIDSLDHSKALWVWWMLRDVGGDVALKKAIAAYKPESDTAATYMQGLIEKSAHRDLQWFFDDWVYHDRGLPSFKVASAFARKNNDAYLLTVTIENAGGAGAEIPVRIRFAGGDIVRRVEVRAKSSAVLRVDMPKPPQEVVVNDGSVPESGEPRKPFVIEAAAEDNKDR